MYMTSETVNFFCDKRTAAFFIRMERMYSTGDRLVLFVNSNPSHIVGLRTCRKG
jgi:hypothetical protein